LMPSINDSVPAAQQALRQHLAGTLSFIEGIKDRYLGWIVF
jgi:hypothetical protein